jgi:hypothetical protein
MPRSPATKARGKAGASAARRAQPPPRKPEPPPTAAAEISLNREVDEFTTADRIAIGDLEIRKTFANRVMRLFAVANVGALIGVAIVFWRDGAQLAAGLIKPSERIIDGHVIMALLGATTVQLGGVIYTLTRAIFPSSAGHAANGRTEDQ